MITTTKMLRITYPLRMSHSHATVIHDLCDEIDKLRGAQATCADASYMGWPEGRVDTQEMAKFRAEREEARHERDRVHATVSEHQTAWARVNQENDKLRSDLTKAEASIHEHKAKERELRAENDRLTAEVRAAADMIVKLRATQHAMLYQGAGK